MKKVLKHIAFSLLTVMSVSTCLTACNQPSSEQDNSVYLFKNATTDYKIVVDSQADDYTLFAIEELQTFLQESSGAKIAVESADNMVHDKNLKVISVGKNDLSESTDLNFSIELQHYEITTLDNSIYIIGGDERGNLFGTYEFLKQLIGFEVYADDEVVYTSASTLKLPDYDLAGGPDFMFRAASIKYITTNTVYAKRLRQTHLNSSEIWLTGNSHNYSEYISAGEPGVEDAWFSYSENAALNKKSLCLHAQGDPESEERMKQYVADVMINKLIINPLGTEINFSQPDWNDWCKCESCLADLEKYGTNSATVIMFVNDVSDRVIAWLNENQPERADKIHFVFLGYHKTQEPPVKMNEDGTYSPLFEEIKLNKQVGVFLAPVFESYNKEVENSTVGMLVKKWSAISERVYMWVYTTNFSHHLYPYNSTGFIQDNEQFYLENNVKYILNHSQSRPTRSTGFHEFKGWLDAHLQWDTQSDVAQLTKDYFNVMFKKAAAPMYEFYITSSTYMTYLENEMLLGGGLYQDVHQTKYWPKGVADSFMRYIEQAYEEIEFYKDSDPELYAKIEARITRESIFPRYILLDLYSGYYSAEELKAERQKLMDDCLRLEVDLVSEWVSIYDGVFKNWGL